MTKSNRERERGLSPLPSFSDDPNELCLTSSVFEDTREQSSSSNRSPSWSRTRRPTGMSRPGLSASKSRSRSPPRMFETPPHGNSPRADDRRPTSPMIEWPSLTISDSPPWVGPLPEPRPGYQKTYREPRPDTGIMQSVFLAPYNKTGKNGAL